MILQQMATKQNARREFIRRLGASAAMLPAGAPNYAAPNPNPPSHVLNVLDFGAIADGRTLCTSAIQAAVDACAKAGGGRVLVPPGNYLTGPIFLKSNLEIEILAGATLLGSTNFSDYPTMQGMWEGVERKIYASMFTGVGLENVSICGRGTLDGQGAVWLEAWGKTEELRKKLGIVGREPENPPGSPLPWPRPRMINLYRCRNVLISGLTIQQSPSWTVHPFLCEDVCIERLTILNPPHSPNTDGIDPECCRNVRISNCYISTGDDCIMIKSGYKYVPGKPFASSENIAVTNCVFRDGGCGVGIGSETAGGVRNLVISNCVCDGTDCGLYFRTARGRGNVVENVSATNFVMRGILDTGVVIGMFYEDEDRTTAQPFNKGTPSFLDFYCSGILIDGARRAVVIEGLPENPMQRVSLENVFVKATQSGIFCSQVHGLSLGNAVVNAAHGPSVQCRNIHDLELVRVRAPKPEPDAPVIELGAVQQALIESCSAAAGSPALVRLTGTANEDLALALNRVSKHSQEIEFRNGASKEAVVSRT